MMSDNEKMLLLQLILEDIRGNWAWNVEPRLTYALHLAQALKLPEHVTSIEAAIRWQHDGEFDGRCFRMAWDHGGYEDGEKVHGLTPTILQRSNAFQKAASAILTYPENRFDDWEAYLASLEEEQQS